MISIFRTRFQIQTGNLPQWDSMQECSIISWIPNHVKYRSWIIMITSKERRISSSQMALTSHTNGISQLLISTIVIATRENSQFQSEHSHSGKATSMTSTHSSWHRLIQCRLWYAQEQEFPNPSSLG